MRILIGYNGTTFSEAAITDLPAAGLPREAEALVVTVAELCFATVNSEDASRLATAAVDRIQKMFPRWILKTAVRSGAAASEILDQADVFRPDLIVLGEGCGNGQNVFIGPVSQRILTDAGCSVRIARAKPKGSSKGNRLLVGFDGSPGANFAVSYIAARSWPSDTHVRLLSVTDPIVLGSIGRFVPQMTDAVVEARFASQRVETLAADALDLLRAAGLLSSVEVRTGHPKRTIVEYAKEWDADCIFVGPHCAGNSYERFLLGSVSAAAAARAACSVEIVRDQERAFIKNAH